MQQGTWRALLFLSALAVTIASTTAQAQAQQRTSDGCFIEGPYRCTYRALNIVFEWTLFRGSYGGRFESTKCFFTGFYAVTRGVPGTPDQLETFGGQCEFTGDTCAGLIDCTQEIAFTDAIVSSVDANNNSVCEAFSAQDESGVYDCALRPSDPDVILSSAAPATRMLAPVLFLVLLFLF
eukprot:TRINITY_DN23355_c0_g1_i1.p1 TRINITY_DN23355_c0_g1~~TRINITY_DN23355_c0_g1_i1.p1  ORF type:complete len:180 (+),score=39.03 TRINITY_DN23355_c0_g1_i1:108-647(+)